MRVFVFILMSSLLPCSALAAVSYSYDAQSRLSQASYADGKSVAYSYDATGNRTGVAVAASAGANQAAAGPQASTPKGAATPQAERSAPAAQSVQAGETEASAPAEPAKD